jgi:hypothetical protein
MSGAAKPTTIYVQQVREPGGWEDNASTDDHELAVARYKAFAAGNARAIVDEQIQKAGVRLATALNRAFRTETITQQARAPGLRATAPRHFLVFALWKVISSSPCPK